MSTFTPNIKVSAESNPRDWAYELACLPANASIIFTKDSLLRFLKTHNIDVSPNYVEINKLPKYAQIGTMSTSPITTTSSSSKTTDMNHLTEQVAELSTKGQHSTAPTPSAVVSPPATETTPSIASVPVPKAEIATEVVDTQTTSTQPTPSRRDPALPHNPNVVTPEGEEFRPTRRVREPIGGGSAQISALFGQTEEDDYTIEAARESARRRGLLQENKQQQNTDFAKPKSVSDQPIKTQFEQDQEQESVPPSNVFRPTRRVREPGGTGGSSSIALG